MKNNILLILACCTCIFCSPQMKLNKNKEIDILIKTPIKLTPEMPIIYNVKNNSDKTFIIDPYGFVGDSYWTFKNKKLIPTEFSRGYYSREDKDCRHDLVIIKPKQKIDIGLSLNYMDKAIYDYSKSGNYIRNIKSEHSRQNGMPSTCKSYINELEKKGYIMLEDSIVAKIPFVK